MELEHERADGNRPVRLLLCQLAVRTCPSRQKTCFIETNRQKKDCPLCSIGGIYK